MTTLESQAAGPLTLRATTASELMTADPLTVQHDDPIQVAAHLMHERGISAVPAVDRFGRAVGVISQFDLVARHPELARRFGRPAPGDDGQAASEGRAVPGAVPVAEVMTPGVFAVATDTPGRDVVNKMVSLRGPPAVRPRRRWSAGRGR
jgi:CBS domain-containing protein